MNKLTRIEATEILGYLYIRVLKQHNAQLAIRKIPLQILRDTIKVQIYRM